MSNLEIVGLIAGGVIVGDVTAGFIMANVGQQIAKRRAKQRYAKLAEFEKNFLAEQGRSEAKASVALDGETQAVTG